MDRAEAIEQAARDVVDLRGFGDVADESKAATAALNALGAALALPAVAVSERDASVQAWAERFLLALDYDDNDDCSAKGIASRLLVRVGPPPASSPPSGSSGNVGCDYCNGSESDHETGCVRPASPPSSTERDERARALIGEAFAVGVMCGGPNEPVSGWVDDIIATVNRTHPAPSETALRVAIAEAVRDEFVAAAEARALAKSNDADSIDPGERRQRVAAESFIHNQEAAYMKIAPLLPIIARCVAEAGRT